MEKQKERTVIKSEEIKSEEEGLNADAQIVALSKRIEFYLTEYSVELLARKMNNGDFIIPAYQREYTWDDHRKSRFIESLILGLPIPFLFFWERPEDGTLEIVDGSQRLRSIEEFLLGNLQLGKLQTLTALSGFRFSDLPESRQRKINNRSIRGVVLNEHADEKARFDMFERINTGSKIANMAEIRRGALPGPFMTLIINLAELPEFIALTPVSQKNFKEREHEELVSRFFAYSDGLDEYKDRPSTFIFNYIKTMNDKAAQDETLTERYRKQFEEVIDFVARVFPHGFSKIPKGKATPRTRFEAIAVGSRLALNKRPSLANATPPSVTTWLTSKEFTEILRSDGANAITLLRKRTEFVRNQLLRESK